MLQTVVMDREDGDGDKIGRPFIKIVEVMISIGAGQLTRYWQTVIHFLIRSYFIKSWIT